MSELKNGKQLKMLGCKALGSLKLQPVAWSLSILVNFNFNA